MSTLAPEAQLPTSASPLDPPTITSQPEQPPSPPWHASFPKATLDPSWLPRETVLQWLKSTSSKDFLLIDLRRADHAGGTITSSLNLPAQSFYYSMETLYDLCVRAGIRSVVFYCGSSAGRGSRAASWFQEYINSQDAKDGDGQEKVKSYALTGGIKGWAYAGDEYVRYMSGYEAGYWNSGAVKCGQ